MAILKVYDDIANENDAVGFFGDRMDVFSLSRLTDFLTDCDAEIDGRLHCRGGSVTEGYACHDVLQNSGKTVKMTVEGMCASIATVILLSAKPENRKMFKNATIFIHNPFIPEFTLAEAYESKDLQALADELKKEEDRIIDFYFEKTGTNKDTLKELMDKGTSLTAEEAKQYGFVSEIITPILNKKGSFNNKFNMENQKIKELEDKLSEKSSLIDKILAKFNLKIARDILAKEITTADGSKLTVENEDGALSVGTPASPDGTFTTTDGKTVVVEGGVITSVTEKQDEPVDSEEVKALKAEIDSLKQQLENKATELTDLQNSVTEVNSLLAEIKNIKSQYVAATRTPEFVQEEKVSDKVQAKLREAEEKYKERNKRK